MFQVDKPAPLVLHLGCQCRPWIMACGIFVAQPKECKLIGATVSHVSTEAQVIEGQETVHCQDCWRMWYQVGCGICRCIGDTICDSCTAGKHAAIATDPPGHV